MYRVNESVGICCRNCSLDPREFYLLYAKFIFAKIEATVETMEFLTPEERQENSNRSKEEAQDRAEMKSTPTNRSGDVTRRKSNKML